MADGIQLNSGSGGQVLQTDEIGGVHYQAIKVAFGSDGTAKYVDSSAGAALPVSVIGQLSVALAAGSTVTVTQSTASNLKVDLSGTAANTTALNVSVVNASGAASAVSITGPVSIIGPVSVTGTVEVSVKGPVSITGTVEVSIKGPVSIANGTVTANAGTGTFQTSVVGPVSITGNVQVSVVGGVSVLNGSITVTQATASNLKVDLSGTAANATALNVSITGPVSVKGAVSIANGQVAVVAQISGGLTISRLLTGTTTVGNCDQFVVKNSEGQIYGLMASNTATAVRFLKVFNTAASPSVGGSTPNMTVMIPPNSSGIVAHWETGLYFNTGIGLGVTVTVTDTASVAAGTNEVVVHVFYK